MRSIWIESFFIKLWMTRFLAGAPVNKNDQNCNTYDQHYAYYCLLVKKNVFRRAKPILTDFTLTLILIIADIWFQLPSETNARSRTVTERAARSSLTLWVVLTFYSAELKMTACSIDATSWETLKFVVANVISLLLTVIANTPWNAFALAATESWDCTIIISRALLSYKLFLLGVYKRLILFKSWFSKFINWG